MAADLHIHVMDGVTEDDLRKFNSHVLGSKYFNLAHSTDDKTMELYEKFNATPNVWIGEVSWLKAALLSDNETYVPDPVAKVSELIGEDLPVIDEALIASITEALGLNNSTAYRVSQADKVVEFLRQHMGKQVFTVSW